MNDLAKEGLNEDNLTVYYFNETTKVLEPINTTVDKENKIITVTLNHFSMYVVGDNNIVLTNNESEIMFVIDNSVSMYSEEQMIAAGYNDSTGAIGNDTEFKRLTLTNKLIDMFTGNYKFGVAEFSGDYVNLIEFSTEHQSVKTAVNGMENNWKSNGSGTNIVSALNKGIEEFDINQNNHYLILLTDGKNTSGSLSSNKSSIISKAQEKNIKICVIGLGNNIDSKVLNEIAETTGCDFYNATDSKALDEIYSLVGADINYNYVDTDNDNKVDGMIIANSGFITSKDGFSFANYGSVKSEQGHCYGMATFAMLYYTNQLPESLGYAHKWNVFKRYEESNGYNLKNTYFESGESLYEYKIQNEYLLSYLLSSEKPDDYRDRVENGVWLIKKEYYDKLEEIGAKIEIVEYTGKSSEITKKQIAKLDIDNEKFKEIISKDDRELLNAIYRLFILQIDDKRTSFNTDPDKAFEELETNLNNGVPIVLNVGNHAVNATRLIQDINNPNKFKIEIYDNNYPGEIRYIELTRSKMSFRITNALGSLTNEYQYSTKYDKNNDGVLDDIQLVIIQPNVN